jgi:hypothetical protein
LLLLVFTQDGVPTWEVRIDLRKDKARKDDLLMAGTADTFEAAKMAALFEANAMTSASR